MNTEPNTPRQLLHLRMDAAVDSALEHIRDNKIVIVIFSIASAVGDFGLLWHIIGVVRAIGSVSTALRSEVSGFFNSCATSAAKLSMASMRL